jgi:hypothetical protein
MSWCRIAGLFPDPERGCLIGLLSFLVINMVDKMFYALKDRIYPSNLPWI